MMRAPRSARRRVARSPGHVALALGAAAFLTGAAQRAEGETRRTPLDARRAELIRRMDERYGPGEEDPRLPRPNLVLAGEKDDAAGNYLNKSLAIFALVEMGEAAEGRLDEANAYLRAMVHKWPVNDASDVLGGYSSVVNHSGRTVFIRTYALYADRLEGDVTRVLDRWLELYCAPPYERSSENIRMTRNSSQFLAHELAGKTELESYAAGKVWLMSTMASLLRDGPHEWGRFYLEWTMGAVLNLAEFSEDAEVQRLATMVVDHYLALLSGFVVNGNFASGSLRSWGWSLSALTPQANLVHNLFPEHHDLVEGIWPLATWVVSNYRPLRVVSRMHGNRKPLETRLSTGTARTWRHYAFRSRDFMIASHQAPQNGSFRLPTGGTHDIYGMHIQSSASPRHCVLPFGCVPLAGPSKQRSQMNRYFTHRNVGFAQTGGTMRGVWAGKREFPGVPLRLFHHFGFEHEIIDGWAFLTDGTIYVAWKPARGVPEFDAETSERTTDEAYGGLWLKSSCVPDADGEACVIEVGDSALFGGYGSFKRSVVRRNPDPVADNGRIMYRTRDGALLEFGEDDVKVDGEQFDSEAYPRVEMPGLRDLTIAVGGTSVVFDPEGNIATGNLRRVPSRIRFGNRSEEPRPAFQ